MSILTGHEDDGKRTSPWSDDEMIMMVTLEGQVFHLTYHSSRKRPVDFVHVPGYNRALTLQEVRRMGKVSLPSWGSVRKTDVSINY